VTLRRPIESFYLWRLVRGFDYRFPPDVLLRQDEATMDDLLVIEDAYRRLTKQG